MGDEKRVDDRVDDGTLAGLVADSPAQVQHEGQVALLRVAGGVLHSVLDTAGHRDAATRVVRDLQPEQPRAPCYAAEPGDEIGRAHVCTPVTCQPRSTT